MSALVWQEQVDDGGCGLACLAMLTDQPYARVRSEFPRFCNNCGVDGDTILHWLADHGHAIQKLSRYQEYAGTQRRWPARPWADRHLVLLYQTRKDCELDSLSGTFENSHYVVLDREGNCYDPADAAYTPCRLSRYYRVIWIAAVYPLPVG